MSRRVRRGTFVRSCLTCGWGGTYTTRARADYAKRRHSCAKKQRIDARLERGRHLRAAIDRTPKPCLHKIANHQHGTYACYTLDSCRCDPCCHAVSQYESNRQRQHAYGRWDNFVDAEPARHHVRALMDQGMGLKRVAATAGVAISSVGKLIYGRHGTEPSKRLRKDVAQALLAVELDLAGAALVDAADTARRLQALVAQGWSMSKLGQRLNILPGNFNPVILGTRRVQVRTAKAVHSLYAELAEQAPPEVTHRDKIAASRARNYAAAKGWPPPLRINGRLVIATALSTPDDEVETDTELGHFDESAVLRRLAGDRSVPIDKADRVELVRRARAAGWSFLDIQHRAGIGKPERYLAQPTDEKEAS